MPYVRFLGETTSLAKKITASRHVNFSRFMTFSILTRSSTGQSEGRMFCMLILLGSFLLGGSLVCRDSFVFFGCKFYFPSGELKGENISILHRHVFVNPKALEDFCVQFAVNADCALHVFWAWSVRHFRSSFRFATIALLGALWRVLYHRWFHLAIWIRKFS